MDGSGPGLRHSTDLLHGPVTPEILAMAGMSMLIDIILLLCMHSSSATAAGELLAGSERLPARLLSWSPLVWLLHICWACMVLFKVWCLYNTHLPVSWWTAWLCSQLAVVVVPHLVHRVARTSTPQLTVTDAPAAQPEPSTSSSKAVQEELAQDCSSASASDTLPDQGCLTRAGPRVPTGSSNKPSSTHHYSPAQQVPRAALRVLPAHKAHGFESEHHDSRSSPMKASRLSSPSRGLQPRSASYTAQLSSTPPLQPAPAWATRTAPCQTSMVHELQTRLTGSETYTSPIRCHNIAIKMSSQYSLEDLSHRAAAQHVHHSLSNTHLGHGQKLEVLRVSMRHGCVLISTDVLDTGSSAPTHLTSACLQQFGVKLLNNLLPRLGMCQQAAGQGRALQPLLAPGSCFTLDVAGLQMSTSWCEERSRWVWHQPVAQSCDAGSTCTAPSLGVVCAVLPGDVQPGWAGQAAPQLLQLQVLVFGDAGQVIGSDPDHHQAASTAVQVWVHDVSSGYLTTRVVGMKQAAGGRCSVMQMEVTLPLQDELANKQELRQLTVELWRGTCSRLSTAHVIIPGAAACAVHRSLLHEVQILTQATWSQVAGSSSSTTASMQLVACHQQLMRDMCLCLATSRQSSPDGLHARGPLPAAAWTQVHTALRKWADSQQLSGLAAVLQMAQQSASTHCAVHMPPAGRLKEQSSRGLQTSRRVQTSRGVQTSRLWWHLVAEWLTAHCFDTLFHWASA